MSLWKKNVSAYLILGSSASKLVFTAVTPGTAGNSIRVKLLGGVSQTLATTVSTNDITIQLGTDGGGIVTSTVDDVIANVAASGPASALVVASTGHVGPGDGIVAVVGTFTNLAGGTDQAGPTWKDSFASTEGWRRNDTGEIMVAAADGATLAVLPSTATIKKATLVGARNPARHFQAGSTGFADEIVLAVEYDKPVYVVHTNTVDGAGNAIALAGENQPANITVNLIDPGAISQSLSGSVRYVNFGDQLIIDIHLATDGTGTITSTVSDINTYAAANNIPLILAGSGTVAAAVLSGPWTIVTPTLTIPITIGVNTRSLTNVAKYSLDWDKFTGPQAAGFSSVLPVENQGTLLFLYKIVSGDAAASVGDVHIGTAAVKATHAFGTGNAEITFTAVDGGVAGNSITVELLESGNQPLSISVVGTAISVNLASAAGTGTSIVSDVLTFLANDSSAGAIAARALVTASTTGNGTGTILAASVQSLTTGADATATITITNGTLVDEANASADLTFNPGNALTDLVTVN